MPDQSPVYNNATYIGGSSGVVSATAAAATLAAATGKTTYITGFSCSFGGATGASVIQVTVAGLLGGTQTFAVGVPAGTTASGSFNYNFPTPFPASAPASVIIVTMPSCGVGNLVACTNVTGLQV